MQDRLKVVKQQRPPKMHNSKRCLLSSHDRSPSTVETYTLSGLAHSYAGLGQELLTRQDVDEVFEALTSVGVRQVPGAEHAGITCYRKGVLETLAATSELVTAVDKIQYALSSGPCVDAVRAGSVLRTGDLQAEPRWPEFGPQAYDATGIKSMMSFRLYKEEQDGVVGINFYSTQSDAFTLWAQTVGLLLATHGALAVANAWARKRNADLSRALVSNRVIGVAIGMLASTHKITPEDALALLRIASQHKNRKLADLASQVVATGALVLPEAAAKQSVELIGTDVSVRD